MTLKVELVNNSIYPESPTVSPDRTKSIGVQVKSDYFELLSVYIDGEATVDERRQVNEWLDNDPEVKSLYLHLLRIRQNLQQMPVPESTQPVSETVERFFWLLDRRRRRTMVKIGGSAIAALFMVTVSGLMPGMPSASQLAKSLGDRSESQQLTIALNRPIVPIPKAAVAMPVKQLQRSHSSIDDRVLDAIYKHRQ